MVDTETSRENMSDTRASIDFSEIESATEFEQFTRDLLQCMGYHIEIPPGEGNDGGKDLIVSELMEGRLSSKTVRYLVSCKHTKRAIGTSDEADILRKSHDVIDGLGNLLGRVA